MLQLVTKIARTVYIIYMIQYTADERTENCVVPIAVNRWSIFGIQFARLNLLENDKMHRWYQNLVRGSHYVMICTHGQ